MKNIFVGNLPWRTDDQELENLFSQYGEVLSAKVISDRETGRSRGFGFVEMEDDAALEAIENLNGQEMDGREIRVNEANDRPQRSGGGGHRGGGGGGGGGHRGGNGGGGGRW
ncbi:MAG: RNA-binding protein [Bacteroidetes Order II. Incertae sedis bacterium]|jgi:RNA recognition motif-containing protein|nr:RNA-binding protein [Bacteroidetes Order II. bacterium]MBT4601580.1 RNA-binding protein [Bacteroidetes Order II. bacterium]MBT5250263.1 RNA-binding protein [Bacteroidetes Order II. bacterium]MBT6200858.1 RNA-binding protein [Bacteroidetes Order II. bacterium]MBT6424565.1 RNA-binding protein [Bacteroidetes Order II. bacterium]